jgi:uncharacterized membrane protein
MSKKRCESKKSKKEIVTKGEKRNKHLAIIVVSVVIAALVAYIFVFSGKSLDGKTQSIDVSHDVVKIPLEKVSDGIARFFHYTIGGKDIKFFVLKSSDGVIRAAFDTCDVCYPKKKGYRQEGDFMVCNNCGQMFESVLINVRKGGCNPVPLDRTVEGRNLVIKVADIQRGAFYF